MSVRSGDSHEPPNEMTDKRNKGTKKCESERLRREVANQDSTLFTIAAELRNKIVAMALPSDQYLTILHEPTDLKKANNEIRCNSVRKSTDFTRQFGLTQVSRQARAETLKLAYESNTWILSTLEAEERTEVEIWVKSRPKGTLESLSRVVLQHWHSPYSAVCFGSVNVLFDFEFATTESIKGHCDLCYQASVAQTTHQYRQVLDQSLTASGERLLMLIERFQQVRAITSKPSTPSGDFSSA